MNDSSNPTHTPEFAYPFAVPALFWAYLRPSLRLYAATVLGACCCCGVRPGKLAVHAIPFRIQNELNKPGYWGADTFG